MLNITKLKYYEISAKNPIMVKLSTGCFDKVYHYTSKAGVEGILASNELHVTNGYYLDDTTEIKYISTVLEGIIIYLNDSKEDYYVSIDSKFYVFDAIIKTLEALNKIYKKGAPISGGDLFILSLTKNPHNPYLMENYCRGDGAILEFNNTDMNIFKKNSYVFTTFRAEVEYDLSKQMTAIIKDINEFYCEFLDNLASNNEEIDYLVMVETVKAIIYTKVINYSFFFKHEKYYREEEYRIMFLAVEKYANFVKTKKKFGRDIPYLKVNFDRNYLGDIKYI